MHLLYKLKALSSNPISTKKKKKERSKKAEDVAQWYMPKALGSIPSTTREKNNKQTKSLKYQDCGGVMGKV
jgi:hypothetical protein